MYALTIYFLFNLYKLLIKDIPNQNDVIFNQTSFEPTQLYIWIQKIYPQPNCTVYYKVCIFNVQAVILQFYFFSNIFKEIIRCLIIAITTTIYH